MTDAQWARIEPLLPDRTSKRGGRRRDHREAIDAIARKFRTGTQWVHVSGSGGPRLRVGFRYLFAARAQAVPRVVLRTGPARWAGPEEVDGRIAARVRAYTGAVGAEPP
ncbi:transposase [Streptomyces ramulosus]|uniref:Transposase n=1 Tax=Streptomyces ramulosus TaxID=47762 RepID=A0ABW1FS28_9ACTN